MVLTLPDPYYDHAEITIYHGDCREILPQLERIGLTLTSPPFKDEDVGAGKNNHEYRIKNPENGDKYYLWLDGVYRVLRKASPLVVMFNSSIRLNDICKRYDPNRILIWDKIRCQQPYRYEPIFIFAHDGIKFNGGIWNDCLNFLPVMKGLTPDENPVPLYQQLLRYFPADITVDSFMGSGTTLVAAKELGRRAIGIEIEEKYCEIAAERLAQEVFDFG